MSDGPTITVERACELLHCGRTRLFELIGEGKLERGPKFGRATTVRTDSVLALLDVPPPSRPAARRGRKPSRAQWAAELRAVPLNGSLG